MRSDAVEELECENEGRHVPRAPKCKGQLRCEAKMPADEQCDEELAAVFEHLEAQDKQDEKAAHDAALREGLPQLDQSSKSKSQYSV